MVDIVTGFHDGEEKARHDQDQGQNLSQYFQRPMGRRRPIHECRGYVREGLGQEEDVAPLERFSTWRKV